MFPEDKAVFPPEANYPMGPDLVQRLLRDTAEKSEALHAIGNSRTTSVAHHIWSNTSSSRPVLSVSSSQAASPTDQPDQEQLGALPPAVPPLRPCSASKTWSAANRPTSAGRARPPSAGQRLLPGQSRLNQRLLQHVSDKEAHLPELNGAAGGQQQELVVRSGGGGPSSPKSSGRTLRETRGEQLLQSTASSSRELTALPPAPLVASPGNSSGGNSLGTLQASPVSSSFSEDFIGEDDDDTDSGDELFLGFAQAKG